MTNTEIDWAQGIYDLGIYIKSQVRFSNIIVVLGWVPFEILLIRAIVYGDIIPFLIGVSIGALILAVTFSIYMRFTGNNLLGTKRRYR